MSIAQLNPPSSPHIPVLLTPILDSVKPVSGIWVDGTFGAGGYSRAILDAGADTLYAIDRDPEVFARAEKWAKDYDGRLKLIHGVFARAEKWAKDYDGRLKLIHGTFSDLDTHVKNEGTDLIDGVVLDIGVSSMQLDQAERGFSFMKDGPLDMRMGQSGMSAADIVNSVEEKVLADLIYLYGEERASRRIARNIVKSRENLKFETTFQLVKVIEASLPRPKPGQTHPATRTFQALRIAVNDELGQLVSGLRAAENILREGGMLAVVTFHSLEDRIVKRFIQARSGNNPRGNRYQPEKINDIATFEKIGRKAISATKDEISSNPRARSAKLNYALLDG